MVPIIIVNIIYNSVEDYWQARDIILRVIGLVFYIGCVYFYKKVFKADSYLWLAIGVMLFNILL